MLRKCSSRSTIKINKNKSLLAFTIAEIIITLGIIGIIANITIPFIYKEIEDIERISKFKKMYSEMAAAAILVSKDNGGTLRGTMANPQTTSLRNNFMPYFKDAKPCNLAECLPPATDDNPNRQYKFRNKSTYITTLGNIYGFILPNDSSYYFEGGYTNCDRLLTGGWGKGSVYCGIIIIDLNGPQKKPNALGWDLFEVFLRDGFLETIGYDNGYRNCTTIGWGCADYILQGIKP